MSEVVEHEYGIRWTAPEDIADSVTVIGKSFFGEERATRMLELTSRLPGGQAGEVVRRTITWSEWKAA
jgi:hypothetical protein